MPFQDKLTMEYTTLLNLISALIFDVAPTTMVHIAPNSVLN